jgi:hypothetical protein
MSDLWFQNEMRYREYFVDDENKEKVHVKVGADYNPKYEFYSDTDCMRQNKTLVKVVHMGRKSAKNLTSLVHPHILKYNLLERIDYKELDTFVLPESKSSIVSYGNVQKSETCLYEFLNSAIGIASALSYIHSKGICCAVYGFARFNYEEFIRTSDRKIKLDCLVHKRFVEQKELDNAIKNNIDSFMNTLHSIYCILFGGRHSMFTPYLDRTSELTLNFIIEILEKEINNGKLFITTTTGLLNELTNIVFQYLY